MGLAAAAPARTVPGDVAPAGAPDGSVSTADALVALRMALSALAVDLNADVAPLGGTDGRAAIFWSTGP